MCIYRLYLFLENRQCCIISFQKHLVHVKNNGIVKYLSFSIIKFIIMNPAFNRIRNQNFILFKSACILSRLGYCELMPCQLIASKFCKKCSHIRFASFGFQIRLAIYFLLNKFAWNGIKNGATVNICQAMFGLIHVCSVPPLSCHPALTRRPARQL